MKKLPAPTRILLSVSASVALALGASSCGGGGEPESDPPSGSEPEGSAAPSGKADGGGSSAIAKTYSRAQSIREVQRLKQCALTLISYSSENGGAFPDAGQLAVVISSLGDAALLHVGGAETGDPLLYAEGITEEHPGDFAILASPVEMAGSRAVAFLDGSVRPLTPEQFAAEQAKLKKAGLELK